MIYRAKHKSLRKHELPSWFDDAKLGLIVSWGIYSIPAFAPTVKSSHQLISEDGWEEYYRMTPYSEWYSNSIKIPGSPAAEYHEKKYGQDFKYEDFAPELKKHIRGWDPDKWAGFFSQTGARYIVYLTKFHDGFLMWPSKKLCPVKDGWYSERDTVKELADAVRAKDIRMGTYYSGAIDWAFNKEPVKDLVDLMASGPATKEYGEYVDSHYIELIDKIKPDILWNDIAYPAKGRREEVISYYYNNVENGCINDRWVKYGTYTRYIQKGPLRKFVNRLGAKAMASGKTGAPSRVHVDFNTPEFTYFDKIQKKKFEAILGFGKSVAYNAQETDSSYHSVEQMVRWFCDIISKNGNLLLVVSPMADGTIPEIQSKRMMEFGAWIKKNSEAIYGSRAWSVSEAETDQETGVRFTRNNDSLFLFLLGLPAQPDITIRGLIPSVRSEISLIGRSEKLSWQIEKKSLRIRLPENLEESPAHVLKITPIPGLKSK